MKPRGERASKEPQGQSPRIGAASIDGGATANLPKFETFFNSSLSQGKDVGPSTNLQAIAGIQVETWVLLKIRV